MQYKATPLMFVRLVKPIPTPNGVIKGFSFNDDGIFETDNETLIQRIGTTFEIVPDMTSKTSVGSLTDEPRFQCKKCNYDTDNRGQLMAHYRVSHPKEE